MTLPVGEAGPSKDKRAAGEEDPKATGLPLLATWSRVYLVVLGSLIAWIALLYAFSAHYR